MLPKDFLIKVGLNTVLLIGILFGYWHLSATLFYYAVEIAYFAFLAGMHFDPKQKKPNLGKGISIGFAGAIMAITFTYYTSALLGEARISSEGAAQSLIPHVLGMIALTWPALLTGGFLHYIQLKNKSRKDLLNTVFPDLINGVITVAFLFFIAFISYLYLTENATGIAFILVAIKILIDYYVSTKRAKEAEKKAEKQSKME